MFVNCCWYNKGNAGRPVFLLQEKPLQYYKLLCRLASDSSESDRLTLEVKTMKQGAWALEFWTERFAKTSQTPTPPPAFLILMVEIKTWHPLIPKAKYKNLVLYELFSSKGQNEFFEKKEKDVYIMPLFIILFISYWKTWCHMSNKNPLHHMYTYLNK